MFNATTSAAMLAPLIAACATTTDTAAMSATDKCGASGYQSLIGTNLAAVTLPADLNDRVIGPNDAYTQDYVPSRLNIFTDENSVVIKLSCG